jgi:hypothetical protein
VQQCIGATRPWLVAWLVGPSAGRDDAAPPSLAEMQALIGTPGGSRLYRRECQAWMQETGFVKAMSRISPALDTMVVGIK